MSLSTDDIYKFWIDQNLQSHQTPSIFNYKYQKKSSENKYIPMPPPNITGKLHMGHGLFLTIQDSLIRYWKNSSHKALWLPGLDHAGLATHEKILKYKKKKKIDYSLAAKHIEKSHKEIILNQIKQIGALPDWSKISYTLNYNKLIYDILKLMLSQGRIYQKDGQIYLNLKDYAQRLLEDLKDDLFDINPSHEIKNLLPFLENFEDWNISRQIPWGTNLPFSIEGNELIFKENPKESLDTWFNSSLWPIAILNQDPKLFKEFYPASILETGGDILFFWCARMLIMSSFCYNHQKELSLDLNSRYCFKKIYLHGIIRDNQGRKFSKSLGNGIDPLDMIKKYGPDATRLFLITRSGPGEDIIFDEAELITYKRFINKIYQSARFLSMYAEKSGFEKRESFEGENIHLEKIQKDFLSLMEEQKFLQASRFIHSKYKEFFCDKWIEENKEKIQTGDPQTLKEGYFILDQMLAMLEPFCPYICSFLKQEYSILD